MDGLPWKRPRTSHPGTVSLFSDRLDSSITLPASRSLDRFFQGIRLKKKLACERTRLFENGRRELPPSSWAIPALTALIVVLALATALA
jgi:hypothetical protein